MPCHISPLNCKASYLFARVGVPNHILEDKIQNLRKISKVKSKEVLKTSPEFILETNGQ